MPCLIVCWQLIIQIVNSIWQGPIPDNSVWEIRTTIYQPFRPMPEYTPTIDQFHKSQNAPLPYPRMLQSEQKCAHFCSEWSILGYGRGAFWDLWIRPILLQYVQKPVSQVDELIIYMSWKTHFDPPCILMILLSQNTYNQEMCKILTSSDHKFLSQG